MKDPFAPKPIRPWSALWWTTKIVVSLILLLFVRPILMNGDNWIYATGGLIVTYGVILFWIVHLINLVRRKMYNEQV